MTASNPIISNFYFAGESSYPDSMAYQDKCAEGVLRDGTSQILGYEYDRVLTLGKRAMSPSDVAGLSSKFSIHSVDRGGLITLHNRGQLVIYPILPLRQMRLGIRDYLRILCQTTTGVLDELFSILAHWNLDHPDGVFVGQEKIAFIGIRVDRGVSKHGISINLRNDTSEFQLFTACGRGDLRVVSVKGLIPESQTVCLRTFFQAWCEEFHRQIQRQLNFQCNQTEILLHQDH